MLCKERSNSNVKMKGDLVLLFVRNIYFKTFKKSVLSQLDDPLGGAPVIPKHSLLQS